MFIVSTKINNRFFILFSNLSKVSKGFLTTLTFDLGKYFLIDFFPLQTAINEDFDRKICKI